MNSFSRDSRSTRSHRRDSSSSYATSTSSRHRPRLLRSSATEPSITTSNAIRGSLAGPGSPQKATDLLNRVAIYSPTSPPPEHVETGPIPHHHQVEAISICRDERDTSPAGSPSSQHAVMVDSPGYYFSFPRFDHWIQDKQEDIDKDSDD